MEVWIFLGGKDIPSTHSPENPPPPVGTHAPKNPDPLKDLMTKYGSDIWTCVLSRDNKKSE